MKTAPRQHSIFHNSDKLFDLIFEHSSIGICLLDLQGRLLKVNSQLCQILGYCRAELESMTIGDITYDDSLVACSAFINDAKKGEVTKVVFEISCIHKDGNLVYVQIFSSVAKSPEGEPKFVIFQIVDITERRKTENRLQESDKKLRALYELSPLGIALTDIHGHFVDFNESFSRICGYTKNELKKIDYWSVTPKKYEADETRQLDLLGRTGCYGPYEKEYIRKDGTLVPVRLNGVILTATDGQDYIWSIVEDISERKAMEMNLCMAGSAIEKSKNSFFWVGSEGEVKFANDFASQNLGYMKDELIGMHVWDFDPDFGPADQGPFFNDIRRNGMAVFESRHRRKNETIFPVEITANYFALNGEEMIFCSVQDITNRKLVEQKLLLTQFAIDQSSVAVYQLNPEGNILYANKEACRSLGYSLAELMAMSISDIDPFYQKEEWGLHWVNLRNLKSLSFETMHKRKDGSIFPIEVSANYITYDGMEYNFAFVRDCTERKLAEKEIQLAATTFESQEAIIITNAEETILRVNRAFTKITGFTSEEVVGNKPSMFSSGRHDDHFYMVMHDKLKTDGFWQGEVWDKHKNGHVYPKMLSISAVTDNSGSISNYVGSFQDISERKESEEKIYNLAFYDALSQLPNRRLMIDRLDHALAASARNGQYGALLYLDIDNFKHLNDTKGHYYGDLLVTQVAERLRACLREDDIVARFGGDEFIVMLENLGENPDMTVVHVKSACDKLVAVLNTSFMLEGYEYHASASIGMTMFHGRESSRETLLTQADMAMYEAKKAGRNTQRFFDPMMQQTLDARVELESALFKAIPNNEFKLFYQLQVDEQARPVGVEALIRWLHPERGLIMPMQFIPLAEENRLIVPIGKWVLETACAQLKEWESADITNKLSIAINISALHFQQDNFVEDIRTVASRYGISPDKLKLELTESVVLVDMHEAIIKMEQLRTLGFILSMDDFGTGYSSLSYLRRLPFNQLKMDRSFILHALENQNDSFLIQMVTSMAEQFGMDVIAEGVETEEQQQHLINLGCKAFQGYLFGRPMPVEEVNASLMG